MPGKNEKTPNKLMPDAFRHEQFYFISVFFKVRLSTEYDAQKELVNFYSVENVFVAAKSMPR